MQKRFLYLVVFFARSKSAGCYVVQAVEIDRNLSRFFLTMASRLSVYDVLERLEDDDDGLYSVTVRQKGSLDTCLRPIQWRSAGRRRRRRRR